ncbi:MAG: vitamin K epoxide reductase family protein [Candidatus Levybacteria bacterium]|nr:vitamin K epoxide reductase family protein [Candidatus Levybacteria bacterium]
MKLIKNKYILPLIGFLAFLGFLDATYLTILHYKNAFPPCTITKGCETVLTSQFATIFGVPIALLGSLFYVSIIAVCLMFYHNSRKIFSNAIFFIAATGVIASILLFYIQLAILKNFCQYCVLSEIINLSIFFLSYSLFKKGKKKEEAKSS